MKVKVYNQEGKEVGSAELPKEIFEVPMNADLVHQVAQAQFANMRIVHAHTKDRSEVRGGGKKPWRQKGTGRARHGSIRSPIWIGGGVTFGPTNKRNFKKKVNKKMKRKALFIALSSKAKDDEIILLDELKLKEPKTKEMAGMLRRMSLLRASSAEVATKAEQDSGGQAKESRDSKRRTKSGKRGKGNEFLVVMPSKDEAIARANRNIPATKTLYADSLNVVDVLSYKYVLMPKESVKVIENTFLKRDVSEKPAMGGVRSPRLSGEVGERRRKAKS